MGTLGSDVNGGLVESALVSSFCLVSNISFFFCMMLLLVIAVLWKRKRSARGTE